MEQKGLDNKIKYYKPNLFRRMMYSLGIKKNLTYDGCRQNFFEMDELAHAIPYNSLSDNFKKSIDSIHDNLKKHNLIGGEY